MRVEELRQHSLDLHARGVTIQLDARRSRRLARKARTSGLEARGGQRPRRAWAGGRTVSTGAGEEGQAIWRQTFVLEIQGRGFSSGSPGRLTSQGSPQQPHQRELGHASPSSPTQERARHRRAASRRRGSRHGAWAAPSATRCWADIPSTGTSPRRRPPQQVHETLRAPPDDSRGDRVRHGERARRRTGSRTRSPPSAAT